MTKKMVKAGVQYKKRFWLILSILGLLIFWLLKTYLMPAGPAHTGIPTGFAMPVEAVSVTLDVIQDDLITVGTLKANEFVMIRPEIEGRIAEIYFKEGQHIKEGEPLVHLDDQIAMAGLAESRAYLSLSESQSERQMSLYRQKYVSDGQKDKVASKLQADQAILNRKKKELEKTKIYAPFDGFVGLSDISPGDYVKPGQDIVSLVCLDPLKIEFSVAEIYAARVSVGQKIVITTDALPNKKFQGEIYALDPTIDESGRNLKIKGKLDNKDFVLKPGMFVHLKIQLAQRNQALLIPEEAIVSQDQKHFVYKIEKDQAKKTFVELGIRTKGKVEILQGVSAQDQVVTAGQIKIRDGMPVKILPVQTTPLPETKVP